MLDSPCVVLPLRFVSCKVRITGLAIAVSGLGDVSEPTSFQVQLECRSDRLCVWGSIQVSRHIYINPRKLRQIYHVSKTKGDPDMRMRNSLFLNATGSCIANTGNGNEGFEGSLLEL